MKPQIFGKLEINTVSAPLRSLAGVNDAIREIEWNATCGSRLVPWKVVNMRIRFGATDTPQCPKCRNIMRLSRRTPHPTRGYDYELQTFTCRTCQHEMQREADVGGNVAE